MAHLGFSPLEQKILKALPLSPEHAVSEKVIRFAIYSRWGETQQTNAARHMNIVLALQRLERSGFVARTGTYQWYRHTTFEITVE